MRKILALTSLLATGVLLAFGPTPAQETQEIQPDGHPVQACDLRELAIRTGIDETTNSPLSPGQSDSTWQVTSDNDSQTQEPRASTAIAPNSAWAPPLPGTQWISANAQNANAFNGVYHLESCFCLRPDFSGVSLDVKLMADDFATVFLNNTPIGQTTQSLNFQQPTTLPTVTNQSLFKPGRNCIQVDLKNTGGVAMGLSLSATLQGSGLLSNRPGCCEATPIKVCKVAGVGVAQGTSFTFTAGGSTFNVPAGPAPGGSCVLGPSFPPGSTVTVHENAPAGVSVSSIVVAPAGRQVGTPDLSGGNVTVAAGPGITEVTYTDKRSGFLEICKRGNVKGNFSFTVNPGNLGPFVVPAGACSPAIEVPAGQVVIQEQPSSSAVMTGCFTIPANRQGACNPTLRRSTVTVPTGDVSTQTVAFITNRRVIPNPDKGDVNTNKTD